MTGVFNKPGVFNKRNISSQGWNKYRKRIKSGTTAPEGTALLSAVFPAISPLQYYPVCEALCVNRSCVPVYYYIRKPLAFIHCRLHQMASASGVQLIDAAALALLSHDFMIATGLVSQLQAEQVSLSENTGPSMQF